LTWRRWLIVIVVAGAAVRFATLGVQSFAEDESTTALLMLRPFGSMVGQLPDSETTPPLFYLLEWLVTHPFGVTEVSARLISALAGTLTIPLAAEAARLVSGRRAAIIGALLVAFNPFLVWYSQEARAYSLLVLFTTAALYFFARLLRDAADRDALIGWSVLSALALLTHYFAVFVLAAEAIWILLRVAPRRHAILAVALPAVTGLALLPLLHAQTHPSGRSFHQKFQVPNESLIVRLARMPREWALGFAAPAGKVLAFVALAVLTWGLVELYRHATGPLRERATTVLLVGATGVLVPALGALGGKSTDFVASRNLIAALVPLLVVAACGLATARHTRWAIGVPVAIGLFAIVLVAADRTYQRPDYRDAMASLGTPQDWRVIAMNRRLADPLVFYGLRTAPVAGRVLTPQRVRELDVLSLPAERKLHPQDVRGLRPPVQGFRLVAIKRGRTWQAAIFRAPRLITVTAPAIRRSNRLLSDGAVVGQITTAR
jgi:mannosyltransferase